MAENTNYIGNISTVIKMLGMMIAGWVVSILAAHGLNLGIDTSMLGEVIGAFIGLVFGYIDAKYPNTFGFLGNSPQEIDDEYV